MAEVKPVKPGESESSLTGTAWGWLALALGAQMGWGAYPVLLRYLQTVSGIPSLSLLAMGNLVVLLVTAVIILPRVEWRLFRTPIVWLFGSMVVLRGLTNLLATRFTLAIYAQLIYLMTPFIVALLSRVVLREQLPRHTIKAMSLALGGALLIMSGNIGQAEAVAGRHDLLGIGLAVASSTFLALYMIVTRRTASHALPGEGLLLVHLLSLFGFSLLVSLLIGENWGQWRVLGLADWLVFGLFSLGVLLGANLGQIRSIQHLGAPLVSSMMAIRLVSALALAGLLLAERLTSVWQGVGTAVVIITITWYLRQQ